MTPKKIKGWIVIHGDHPAEKREIFSSKKRALDSLEVDGLPSLTKLLKMTVKVRRVLIEILPE